MGASSGLSGVGFSSTYAATTACATRVSLARHQGRRLAPALRPPRAGLPAESAAGAAGSSAAMMVYSLAAAPCGRVALGMSYILAPQKCGLRRR
jgi:hypothetical protein